MASKTVIRPMEMNPGSISASLSCVLSFPEQRVIKPKKKPRYNEHTVESRFPEPPGETQIGSRNREFEKSKVASN